MASVTMQQDQPVAFIGLGAMGYAMSTHLVRQGIPVRGYDIWKPSMERFESTCSTIPNARYSTALSPAETVKSSSILLLMVATYQHVDSALFDPEIGAVKTMPSDSTVIIMSTVPPTYPLEVRQRLDNEFHRPDVRLIDAPVSGGTARSANGTLTIMSSSNDSSAVNDRTVQTALTNLSSQGKTLFVIPGTLGAGTSAKALNQVQCGIHIVGGSEIMALAAISKLNTSQFYEAMQGQKNAPPSERPYGWTWMLENRGPRMLDTSLPISSAVSIINKDVNIIKDEEARLHIELGLLNTTQALLTETMKTMASLDDAWINQYYLGQAEPSRKLLTEQQVSSTTLSTDEQQAKTSALLIGHAVINFQSAYETFAFAEALDLLGEKQRQMWFAIIANAAGGSRVFAEVIPEAFSALESGQDWRTGFSRYAQQVFRQRFATELNKLDSIVAQAENQGVEPVLLKTALPLLKQHFT